MTASPTYEQVNQAANVLLDAAVAATAKPLLPEIMKRTDKFGALVRLEVAASMAINQLLVVSLGRAIQIAETMEVGEKEAGHHVLQASVSPLAGAIMAFTNDMPGPMRSDFMELFLRCLNEVVKLRE